MEAKEQGSIYKVSHNDFSAKDTGSREREIYRGKGQGTKSVYGGAAAIGHNSTAV